MLQLINIGSLYNYGNEVHAEFLCVVSREYESEESNVREPEPTDRAKVAIFDCFFLCNEYTSRQHDSHQRQTPTWLTFVAI